MTYDKIIEGRRQLSCQYKTGRLDRCTFWGTLQFPTYSLRHNTGDDISREAKEITNTRIVSKEITVFKVTAIIL